VLEASGGETLTLVTCYPFYYVGSAPKRFIVHARQVAASPQRQPLPSS
jgi:sortase A